MKRELTGHVVTRWYRAPEIILLEKDYGPGIDIWSVGCILAEMIIGKPLFPGTSTINQLELIIELLGKPTAQDIDSIDHPIASALLNQIEVKKKLEFN